MRQAKNRGKVADEKLYEMAGIDKTHVIETGELPFSDTDKAAKVAFMFNGSQKISLLTKEMRSILESMYYSIVEKEKNKKFSDIINKAR